MNDAEEVGELLGGKRKVFVVFVWACDHIWKKTHLVYKELNQPVRELVGVVMLVVNSILTDKAS